MADVAEIEALRATWSASLSRAPEASSREVAMLFRAPLFAPQEAAGFIEALPDLDTWAMWRFGSVPATVRQERSSSTSRGIVQVSNATTAAVVFAAGELVLERAGVSFRNLDAITVAPSGSKPTRVEAETGGEAGTALAGATLTLVPPIAGVTATAAGDLIGSDASTRLEVVTGIRNPDPLSGFLRTLRRADLTPSFVTRGRSAGGVLTVAGPLGALSSPDLELVRNRLRRAVALVQLGLNAKLVAEMTSAAPVVVPVAYTLEVLDELGGVTSPASVDLAAAIATRLDEHIKSTPIGPTTLYRSALDTAARAALGMTVGSATLPTMDALSRYAGAPSALVSLTITAPAADVVLAAHEVAVLGTITPSITRL